MNRRTFLQTLMAVIAAPLVMKREPLAFHRDAFSLVMHDLQVGDIIQIDRYPHRSFEITSVNYQTFGLKRMPDVQLSGYYV